MINFNDIFKSDFLNSASLSTFSVLDTVLSLGLAFVLGLFIYFVYGSVYIIIHFLFHNCLMNISYLPVTT